MIAPNFKSIEAVQSFLNGRRDAWYRPIVEEYLTLIHAGGLKDYSNLDVEELNGYIEHEMYSFTNGYEEWHNRREGYSYD